MLTDIVLDTNVLMHAGDPRQGLQASCVKLLEAIQGSSTKLCVDGAASLNSGSNRSQIMAEYLTHLPQLSLGRTFLAYIVSKGRLAERSKSVNGTTGKLINMHVVDKGCDRVFVRVAVNAEERMLVSHDLGDIPQKSRKVLREKLAVRIVTAVQALPAVLPDTPEPA